MPAVDPERPLSKEERQRLVASIVARRPIGTQRELAEALTAAGCPVTQATVSRDIRELGLGKERDPVGRPRYVLPGARRSDPRTTLTSLLGQFGRGAVSARNIVVVRCEIGSAPAIARALDRVGHALVVGTLAGDDTCLVVTPGDDEARELAAELERLAR